jgi:acetyl esterase/lipase
MKSFHLLIVCLAGCCLAGCTKFDMLDATVPSCGYLKTSDLAFGPLPRQKLDVYRPEAIPPRADVVIFFYGGDPQHLYLMGHSAGAYIAVMLTLNDHYLKNVGLNRTAIRATAGLAGPYDFIPHKEDWGVFSMTARHPFPHPDIEPINYVDGQAPPLLLIQGLKDTTVNPDNAAHLAARIHAAGGSVEVIRYPKQTHVQTVLALAWSFRWLAPCAQRHSRILPSNAVAEKQNHQPTNRRK